jgi:thiol-disulfide isomerase/thioredoxin
MTPEYLKSKFDAALPYEQYLATGTTEQQRRWRAVEPLVRLSEAQQSLLNGFVRSMHVLCISGTWCGDCVQQCPMLEIIARAAPQVTLRFVDRDLHKDLSEQVQLNAGMRVPTVLFLAEDFAFCGLMGDRTLSRYRSSAAKQLGAACPVGIIPPEGPEVDATLGEWVNEFERIQLMLRLSARLREKHGD